MCDPFVELVVRTNYSFLSGASPPAALFERAKELGYDALAIADEGGLYGAARALEAAEKYGLRLVLGCELTLFDGELREAVVVHVQNHAGYTNLCRVLTESHKRRVVSGKRRRELFPYTTASTLGAHADGLFCLALDVHEGSLAVLRETFGERLSLAVYRHHDGDDRARMERACALAAAQRVPLCATNRVRYARRGDRPVADVLHCIREGTTLDEAGRALEPNAEAHLRSPGEMARLFRGREACLERAREIADACRFSLRELRYRFPCDVDSRHTIVCAETGVARPESPDEALRRLTAEGALRRYPSGVPTAVQRQVDKELKLIRELEVAPYFLSVHAIVELARSRDILCQGRGSAANSAVCYCLGVTAVDPARSSLLFERFLSAERREPPDIDIDFEHERREEVIQAIYERYGRDRAAMVSEVIAYRGRSALRDVGKVFGLSLLQVERVVGLVDYWDSLGELAPERLADAGLDPNDRRVQQTLQYARKLQRYPRHLSIHVGGFVLSAEPLVHVAPIEPAAMVGRTVIPWDKDDLDTLGFFKVDVLALGILSAIRKALELAQGDARICADTAIERLARIPPEDPSVYDALCGADTVGVFQIESRAQMSMLPRLLPRKFYDLVIEVAIVRPGPIQGGMVHPYLRRRRGQEPVDIPHPSLTPILERTLGVPIFQEQVMQIAIVGAGYTGGEADQLRRDMAAWRRHGRLEQHRERLARGFAERGIDASFGDRLYQQIQGFAEYGFPESHAASFALLVYASAWLKVHHTAAFIAATLNSQPMGFYSANTLLQDATRHHVELRPMCVGKSEWDSTLEESTAGGPALRVGLRELSGLGEGAGRRIVGARRESPLLSVEDLAARARLDARELRLLAEAGALEALVPGRREALWEVLAPRGEGLFRGHASDEAPALFATLDRAEQLLLDYERTGISVADHPMRHARARLPKLVKSAIEVQQMPHRARVATAGLVICRQRPYTARGVVFVTMEDETGFINLIFWSDAFERFRQVVTTSSLLLARGAIERDGGVVYVIVDAVERVVLGRSRVPSMSRDFH